LIYIGDYQTVTQLDELNGIIEKFKENQKAIYVNEIEIVLIIIFISFLGQLPHGS
jgi:hypothetical protein